ncbi:MAG: DUF4149 domain-containing protein [Leptothrix sp. (in: Bacteria)]|nr:DUF4149 domain-containing protein [Leptothrix sp. (in: b-proteobacteria)]
MNGALERLRRLLPALWLGLLLCVAGIATPAAFALLAPGDAGRVVARVLAQEAWLSLALGVAMLLLERRAAQERAATGGGSLLGGAMLLVLGTLFCTLAGYFAVQPMLVRARLGQGPLAFGQLHAVSLGFFVLKTALVAALAWRAARR